MKTSIDYLLVASVSITQNKGKFQAIAYDASGNELARGKNFALEAKAEKEAKDFTMLAEAARRKQKVRDTVRSGVCPRCSKGLRRNSSMAGWWQCEQFGSPVFRKDPELPACGFSVFE